jgi:ferric-dicitrate binding protein FerR (iron transport regulator)
MNTRDDHAARLISATLLGQASEEEARELERWRAECPENEEVYQRCLHGEGFGRAVETYRGVDWEGAFRRFDRERRAFERERRDAGRERRGTGRERQVIERERGAVEWERQAAGRERQVIGRPARRWTVARGCAAAAVLVAVATGAWFALDKIGDGETAGDGIRPGHAHAVLTRSTGERFVLDEGRETGAALPSHIRRSEGAARLVYGAAPEGEVVENRMVTPRGGEYRLTLSDGSRVHLNARASLRYPEEFRGEAREVYLSGEAWFEVAADSARPFVVVTDDARVRVYGTRFNVDASRAGVVQAALVSGSIGLTFRNREGETMLREGEVAEYRVADGQLTVRAGDLLPHVGWKDNLFAFSGEPLGEILERLGDWYDFSVVYAGEGLAATRFSGVLKRYDDISIILEAIEKTVGVTFRVSGRVIVVSGGRE